MLTLNIEDDSLKMTLIKGKRVIAAIDEPLPAGAVQNGVVIDRQAVSGTIKSLLEKNSIAETDVLACVSGIHSIFRVVSVPRLDRKLLAEVSRKEMERVSPVPLNTLYISWQEVRTSGSESALCLMGLPHDNVDSVIETLRLSGLKAKAVELKPLVVARVIESKTAITVNIQSGSYDIAIVDNMVPELIRSLSFPGENMTAEEKIAAIREELSRTVNFYNSSHSGRQLNESAACYVSGAMSGELAQQLNYSVKPLPEPFGYPAGTDKAGFAANTGLALGASGAAGRWMKVAFNVVPSAVSGRQEPKSSPLPLVALALGICIIVALSVVNGTVSKETARLKGLVDEKNKQVTDIQKLLKEDRDKVIKQRDDLKTTIGQLKAPLELAKKSRDYINHDLGGAIAALPGVMYLTSIGYTEDVITLAGMAPDSDSVMAYARVLRQSGSFKQVGITSLSNKSYNDTRFTLTLTPDR